MLLIAVLVQHARTRTDHSSMVAHYSLHSILHSLALIIARVNVFFYPPIVAPVLRKLTSGIPKKKCYNKFFLFIHTRFFSN